MDRILGYIGSYFVKLGSQVDALVFAGGIGEKSPMLRKTLVERSHSLGFAINDSANSQGPPENQTVVNISRDSAKEPRVMICQTNEQVFSSLFLVKAVESLTSV